MVRRAWRCGWLPESERDENGKPPVPAAYTGPRPTECPGRLIALPQVLEAARAYGWRKEGALREFYDGEPLTPLAKFAIDVMAGSLREVEQHRIRTANKER